MFWTFGIAFNVWVIFMGGAEKLENTVMAYLEYGVGGEKASHIKFVAWVALGFCIYAFFKYVV